MYRVWASHVSPEFFPGLHRCGVRRFRPSCRMARFFRSWDHKGQEIFSARERQLDGLEQIGGCCPRFRSGHCRPWCFPDIRRARIRGRCPRGSDAQARLPGLQHHAGHGALVEIQQERRIRLDSIMSTICRRALRGLLRCSQTFGLVPGWATFHRSLWRKSDHWSCRVRRPRAGERDQLAEAGGNALIAVADHGVVCRWRGNLKHFRISWSNPAACRGEIFVVRVKILPRPAEGNARPG